MSITKLYNGEVELHFDEAKHKYTVNGEPVASVTGILKVISKPALMYWAGNTVANYWLEAVNAGESYDEIQLEDIHAESKRSFRKASGSAASIGTIVHDYAEKVGNGETPEMPVNEQAQNGCRAFNAWRIKEAVEFVETEFKVYSRDFNFVGTCDLDCIIDGKRTLLDYKNSSGIYPEMHLQTAGYTAARIEELDIVYDQRAIVLFNKKTGAFKVEYRDMKEQYTNDLLGFLACLELTRSLDSFKKRKK